jgi:hypothetical protein
MKTLESFPSFHHGANTFANHVSVAYTNRLISTIVHTNAKVKPDFILDMTARANESVPAVLSKAVEKRIAGDRFAIDVLNSVETVGRIIGVGKGKGGAKL